SCSCSRPWLLRLFLSGSGLLRLLRLRRGLRGLHFGLRSSLFLGGRLLPRGGRGPGRRFRRPQSGPLERRGGGLPRRQSAARLLDRARVVEAVREVLEAVLEDVLRERLLELAEIFRRALTQILGLEHHTTPRMRNL